MAIAGDVAAAATAAEPITVRCPRDGRVIDTVTASTAEDVRCTADRLRVAQPGWEALGVRGRAPYVAALRDWILDHEARLLDLLQAETGKTRPDAVVDLLSPLDAVNHYLSHGAGYLAEQRPRPHALAARTKRLSVSYRPYPLVGVISPWNFPLGLSLLDALPALIAGCAVVLEPSEVSPLTVLEIGRAWRQELNAPEVFAVLGGAGATGEAVVDAADYVQFTGSTRTGKAIMRRAAQTLTPVSLELGGKDAMIVCADADLDRAAAGAVWGGMFNAGQVCVSVERVYVEAGVHDAFVDRVLAEVRTLRVGPDGEVGALASEPQAALVEQHVAQAVGAGAVVRCGGARVAGAGTTFAPTVLTGVNHAMSCMTEETFGPTLPIMRVADADEAVRLANDSPYGLSASVWTRDRERGRAIARRLEAGAVNVNDVIVNLNQVSLPMGGWKQSGLGTRLGGAHGLRKFCRAQAITEARLVPAREPTWFPYTRGRQSLVRRLVRLTVARGRRRLSP
ncbi:MAG: aldehyde dehydrogenase [Solirubrobacterales bacterium]|nr:aldehyde dehydrogenase [Solirubrobacterales bacterium]